MLICSRNSQKKFLNWRLNVVSLWSKSIFIVYSKSIGEIHEETLVRFFKQLWKNICKPHNCNCAPITVAKKVGVAVDNIFKCDQWTNVSHFKIITTETFSNGVLNKNDILWYFMITMIFYVAYTICIWVYCLLFHKK